MKIKVQPIEAPPKVYDLDVDAIGDNDEWSLAVLGEADKRVAALHKEGVELMTFDSGLQWEPLG